MVRRGRKAMIVGAALVAGMFATWVSVPAGAEEPRPESPPTIQELKLANAEKAATAQTMSFGAEPWADVSAAAADAAANASCSIDEKYATALSVAMIWPEVSPSGEAPSPMTLSRYDTQPTLGDPQGRANGLWFHPGIGMWQLDSAGLGTDYTAMEAMDTRYAASRMVPFVVNKFCANINNGATAPAARAAAWTDWNACRGGACDTIFWRIYNNGVTLVDGVDRHGGGEVRTCAYGGTEYECLFVDAANAQGADWWAAPGGGRSPIAAPFYVFKVGDGDPAVEIRYWLAGDSGAATDVVVSRDFGANARGGLVWETGSGFCDVTTGSGSC